MPFDIYVNLWYIAKLTVEQQKHLFSNRPVRRVCLKETHA